MAEGPFDHLEIKGDESSLPEEVKLALHNAGSKRMEFGPVASPSEKVLAMRVDGRKIYYSNDEMIPPWYDDLLHFVGEKGVTLALIDFARNLGSEVVGVESLPARAVAQDPPTSVFNAAAWKPEKDGFPTEEQLASRPATPLMKLARAAAIVASAYLWWMHQKYINQHPLRDIDGRLSREAHEGALQKAAHNYW